MRTSLPIRITAACLLATMAACTTWTPYQAEYQSAMPERLRIELASHDTVELAYPYWVGRDSIAGQLEGSDAKGVARTVSLADVNHMEARQSRSRTALLLLGAAAVGLVLYGVYSFATSDECIPWCSASN